MKIMKSDFYYFIIIFIMFNYFIYLISYSLNYIFDTSIFQFKIHHIPKSLLDSWISFFQMDIFHQFITKHAFQFHLSPILNNNSNIRLNLSIYLILSLIILYIHYQSISLFHIHHIINIYPYTYPTPTLYTQYSNFNIKIK